MAEIVESGGMRVFARVESLGIHGLNGYPVTVEADLSSGLPAFDIVGLPDAAVSESKNRVRAAIRNAGLAFPVSRITVNLAPADKRKSGPMYDLPILLAILCAGGQLDASLEGSAFLGELSLDGALRPVNGVLSMALAAVEAGKTRLFVPTDNALEAAVASGLTVYGVASVGELLGFLRGGQSLAPTVPVPFRAADAVAGPDFADVKGQAAAKRAAEIAAAGGHNLLMIGPAGTGKSMIAKRIPSILPPLSFEEAVETTRVYSAAGLRPAHSGLMEERPFRSPHHTVSAVGLAGGGQSLRPGEIALAHNGVLFLDELPEFDRRAMEVLRQPLEDGVVTISRASGSLQYPSDTMLVAAMNPCPCGNFGNPAKPCACAPHAVERYLGRISGPLLDRIDLHVEVTAVEYEELTGSERGESSAEIRARVIAARERQERRRPAVGARCNAKLSAAALDEVCDMTSRAEALLRRAFDALGFSARAYDKVRRVARTIADLEGAQAVDAPHVAEAVQFRALDKKYWMR